jgi:5-methylcytosine-specific restriction endonuclease McrA
MCRDVLCIQKSRRDYTMSDPTPTEKRCYKCGEIKPVEAFSKQKRSKDGYQSHCKACGSAYYAANVERIRIQKQTYYAANRDAILEHNSAYRAANRDTILAQKRLYGANHYAANRDSIRKRHRAHYAANPGRAAAYYAAHIDVIRERHRAYRAAHLDVFRARNHRRRARIKGNGGAGVSSDELKTLRAVQNGFCAYCGFPWIAPLHIDHVIPIRQGGPHEIANIVLACRDCNHEKHARTPEQWTNRWYQRLPRPFSCER